jgi:hypothetical protein
MSRWNSIYGFEGTVFCALQYIALPKIGLNCLFLHVIFIYGGRHTSCFESLDKPQLRGQKECKS